jgi:hypothetical protein
VHDPREATMINRYRRTFATTSVTGLLLFGGVACNGDGDDVGDDLEEGFEDLGDEVEDLGDEG